MIRLLSAKIGYSQGSIVLSSCDLDIRESECVTFIGPSGCGKSTLLLVIAGMLNPLAGERLLSSHWQDRDIICCGQSDTLLPWRTVLSNIVLGSELGSDSRPSKSISDSLVATFRLEHTMTKRTVELSGGMAKRVCLARTFANDPALALLDEPFNNLDFADRVAVENYIRQRISEGRAIGCITHDVMQAVAISDRVIAFAHTGDTNHQHLEEFTVPADRSCPPQQRREDSECRKLALELQRFVI